MNLELWKRVKKEKKLTIAHIAELANLPKGTVQNIFCGYIPNPRIDTVQAIERALGLDVPAIGQSSLSPEESELITAFRSLLPEMQSFVLGMIKDLRKTQDKV